MCELEQGVEAASGPEESDGAVVLPRPRGASQWSWKFLGESRCGIWLASI